MWWRKGNLECIDGPPPRLLNAVEATVPAGKLVHCILDYYATHKHPKVRAWLDRHERWTFHYTPTSASWLNAAEGFQACGTFGAARRAVGRNQPVPRRAQLGA